jgi:uncharacterized membrane protein YdbT with pleckstrin-like domain
MPEIPYQLSRIELWVQAAFRVPGYPHPPEGSPESIQVFHAGRNYYTWRLLMWFLSHTLILVALVAAHFIVPTALTSSPEWAQTTWRIFELLVVLAFAASALFSFFSQRLNYTLRWYIITDRSLRIRTGVLQVRELTMTFSNIQEIRVTAGPLQNVLKLADVEVHSAGGGPDAKGGGHVGRFTGVSNANAIRDLMVERLRQYRDSGLGEPAPHGDSTSDQVIDAARAVLSEARALREDLANKS